VASQFFKRVSRGWVESIVEVVVVVEDGEREGPMPERRVSWRPGAEGAPVLYGARWE
jgi:hypothetical protein